MRIRNRITRAIYRELETGGEKGGIGGTPPADPPPAPPAETEWTKGLDETTVASLTKNGIKDIGGLAKQFVDQQAYLGNSIRVPSADAGDEDKTAFYDKLKKHAPNLIPAPNSPEEKSALMKTLGVPDESSAYAVDVPDAVKSVVDDARMTALKEVAHKHNLTADQFKGVLGDILTADASAADAARAEFETDQAGLKTKWGEAFDSRVQAVKAMAGNTGAPDALLGAIDAGQIDGATMQWIFDLTTRLDASEGTNLNRDRGTSVLAPDEAETQISEMMNNREHPYWIPSHPDHAKAKERMIALGRLASPTDHNRQIGSAQR